MKDKDNYIKRSVWCNQWEKNMNNEFSDTNNNSSQQIGSDKLIDAMCDEKGIDTTSSWTQYIIEISDKSTSLIQYNIFEIDNIETILRKNKQK